MTQRNDGGPAFPVPDGEAANNGHWGMTLRDYAAIEAMVGMLAFPGTINEQRNKLPEDISSLAYEYADAMLKEREK